MADGANNTPRQATAGSWKPGQSGNPAGRKRGSFNRATQLARSLLAGAADELVHKAIEMALAGDPVALRLCLERLIPQARNEPSLKGIKLPAMNTAQDLPLVTAGLLQAVLAGKLSLIDVMPALQIITTTANAISTGDHDQRLAQLERLVSERRLRHGN